MTGFPPRISDVRSHFSTKFATANARPKFSVNEDLYLLCSNLESLEEIQVGIN